MHSSTTEAEKIQEGNLNQLFSTSQLNFFFFVLHYRAIHISELLRTKMFYNCISTGWTQLLDSLRWPIKRWRVFKTYFVEANICDLCLFTSARLYCCREPKFCTKTMLGMPSVGHTQRASRQLMQSLRAVCTPCAVAIWWKKCIYTNHVTMLSQDS